MHTDLDLPNEIPEMKASDVEVVARRAFAEAHGELFGGFLSAPYSHLMDLGYPVPKYMALQDCMEIIASHLPQDELAIWRKRPLQAKL